MTIREYILNGAIKTAQTRLEKLKEMSAPQIMIATLEADIEQMQAGSLKIGGDVEVLDEELVSREFKTRRGGKQYIQINGCINFFPNAKYGMYVKKA